MGLFDTRKSLVYMLELLPHIKQVIGIFFFLGEVLAGFIDEAGLIVVIGLLSFLDVTFSGSLIDTVHHPFRTLSIFSKRDVTVTSNPKP